MFDRVCGAAEKFAVHVSRRQFFGWASKCALAVAGLLAFGGLASAAGCPKGYFACASSYGGYICCPNGSRCCYCGGFPVCSRGDCKHITC
jgi:hypothetical protein